VSHLVQPHFQSSVTYSRLHRTLSRWVLNISREGESTSSLGSLFQGSVTLRGKKFFLMFKWNFLCFSLCPFPLVLLLAPLKRVWPHPLDIHPSDIYKHILGPLSAFSRLNKPSSLSLSSSPLIILVALCWTLSSSSSSFLNWGAQNWTEYSRWGLTRAD